MKFTNALRVLALALVLIFTEQSYAGYVFKYTTDTKNPFSTIKEGTADADIVESLTATLANEVWTVSGNIYGKETAEHKITKVGKSNDRGISFKLLEPTSTNVKMILSTEAFNNKEIAYVAIKACVNDGETSKISLKINNTEIGSEEKLLNEKGVSTNSDLSAIPTYYFKNPDIAQNKGKIEIIFNETAKVTNRNFFIGYIMIGFEGDTDDKVLIFEDNVIEAPSIKDGEKSDITVVRVMLKDGWNTLCVPFNADEVSTKGALGNDVKLRKYSKDENDVITMVNAESIEAGVPYLVNVGSKDVINPMFIGVTLKNVSNLTSTGSNYDFIGTNKITTVQKDYDLLVGGKKLMTLPKDGQIKGLRAYFHKHDKLDLEQINNIKLNIEDELGETTVIDGVEYKTTNNAVCYNLNGQRVGANHKGIMIVNGKKVVRQ